MLFILESAVLKGRILSEAIYDYEIAKTFPYLPNYSRAF